MEMDGTGAAVVVVVVVVFVGMVGIAGLMNAAEADILVGVWI